MWSNSHGNIQEEASWSWERLRHKEQETHHREPHAHQRLKIIMSWKNLSSGFCDQVWLNRACSATEAGYCLEISGRATTGIILSSSKQQRHRRCAGSSAHLLFAYGIGQVFSWCGSYEDHSHIMEKNWHSDGQWCWTQCITSAAAIWFPFSSILFICNINWCNSHFNHFLFF